MTTGDHTPFDDISASFDTLFFDEEYSAFVAELTRRIVQEHELAKRRDQVFRRLGRQGWCPPPVSADAIP